jgi:hypothetical protein
MPPHAHVIKASGQQSAECVENLQLGLIKKKEWSHTVERSNVCLLRTKHFQIQTPTITQWYVEIQRGHIPMQVLPSFPSICLDPCLVLVGT